jgi:uncharacterized membrane protein YcaP (DUF421 family)
MRRLRIASLSASQRVALGSLLSSAITSKDFSLAEALLAFVLLIGFQLALHTLARRSHRAEKIIVADPRLLLHRGEIIRSAMESERVTEEELRAAIRAHGFVRVEDVRAVLLEADGTFTVMGEQPAKHETALADVAR